MSTFLTYVKDYLNKLTFNLKNIPGSEIFNDFITSCITTDQQLTTVRRSEIKQFYRCIRRNVDLGSRLFDTAVSSCLSSWYRTHDFNKFTACVLDRVGRHPISNIVKICAESLPEDEKLPYALTMCVYGGIELFNSAVNRLYKDLKKIVK
ncbi:MAG: hypothetical protein GXO26_08330 [Crenarchaeota archaeon]|nr:hypothetical protein [Thermoproteota archaeon]